MNLSLEQRALGWALLTAVLSMGGAWFLAGSIKMTNGSTPPHATAPSSASSTEIASSPEVVAKGRAFFEMSCSQCHGDDAHGDEGPDLHNLAISNARIATTIKKGVKGEMPTFAKKYDDAQVAILVTYLRSLR